MLLDFFNKIKDIMDISEINKNEEKVSSTIEIETSSELEESNDVEEKEEQKYIHKFGKCVLKEYSAVDGNIGCAGDTLVPNYSVASHNLPCGTKIYIPTLKGKINNNGIFEVMDTGGCSFDFDMYLGDNNIGKIGNSYEDVYVLQWGNGKMTSSYTYVVDLFKKQGRFEKYEKSWKEYKEKGKLIRFFKFNDEDKNLTL